MGRNNEPKVPQVPHTPAYRTVTTLLAHVKKSLAAARRVSFGLSYMDGTN